MAFLTLVNEEEASSKVLILMPPPDDVALESTAVGSVVTVVPAANAEAEASSLLPVVVGSSPTKEPAVAVSDPS